MLTTKGKEEILKLIESDLVNGWDETDQALKNVLRMLLTLRPDLVKIYFAPAAWQKITGLGKSQAAMVILASLKSAVVEANGTLQITSREQARFYFDTHVPRYQQMAKDWCMDHPDECSGNFHSRLTALEQSRS